MFTPPKNRQLGNRPPPHRPRPPPPATRTSLTPKVVGFLRELQFPPTGNDDRVGLDKPQTNPSIVAVLPDQTLKGHVFARHA